MINRKHLRNTSSSGDYNHQLRSIQNDYGGTHGSRRQGNNNDDDNDEEEQIRKAIELSLKESGAGGSGSGGPNSIPSQSRPSAQPPIDREPELETVMPMTMKMPK